MEDLVRTPNEYSLYSEVVLIFQNGETMTLSTTELIKEEPMSVDSDYPVAPVRRLRLRGDWSDTGPDARPQNYPPPGVFKSCFDHYNIII